MPTSRFLARVAACLAAMVCATAPAQPAGERTHGGHGLPRPLANAITASGLSPKSFGLYAQEVVGNRIVLALNEERPYTMASTAKIVTSLAALDLLGPSYRWHTAAFALGTLADGRLAGDLLIVGGGNALLTSGELSAWFARMREQGLREIDGDIVLDRCAFQLQPSDHAHTPLPSASEPRHVWPDAMTLDEGLLGIVVAPTRGKRPVLALQPALADVQIDNRMTMDPGGACEAAPHWQAHADGRASVVVNGSWGAACGARTIGFVPPPDSGLAARALPALWAAAGGVLHGRVVSTPAMNGPGMSPPGRHGPGPHGTLASSLNAQHEGTSMTPIPTGPDGEPLLPLSFHRSKPLPELVRNINKTSDNVAARNLMLSLSPGFPRQPATLVGAQHTVEQWLHDQGLAAGDIELENGSGLSHSERARPRALVQLLRHGWRAEQARAFFESLPIAGVDGTLKNRLTGGQATGQAFLKTGSLNDTRALAGYVHGSSGKMYAVALMVNDADPARGRPALDAIVEWLVRNG